MVLHPMTGVLVRGDQDRGVTRARRESGHPERDLSEHADSRGDCRHSHRMSVFPSSDIPGKLGNRETAEEKPLSK